MIYALSGRGGILAPISSSSPFPLAAHLFSSDSGEGSSKKRVEDVMPIATGLEREELAAELEGKKRFDMDAPEGPFGTKLEVISEGGPVSGPGPSDDEDEH